MGQEQGFGTESPSFDRGSAMEETGHGVSDPGRDPRPTGEHDVVEHVYADVASAQWALPLLGAVAGLGLVVLIVVQLTGSSGDANDGSVAPDERTEAESDVSGQTQQELAQGAAVRFEQALNSRSLTGVAFAFDDPAEAQEEFASIWGGLDDVDLRVDIADVVLEPEQTRASVPVETTWVLRDIAVAPPPGTDRSEGSVSLQTGTAEFTTNGVVDVVQVGTEWLVDWSPTVVDERLLPGDKLVFDRVPAARAPILGADGFELVGDRPAIAVGVVPRQSPTLEPLAATLARLFQLDEAQLLDSLRRSPSDDVFPVTVRRIEEVDQVRAELNTTPGIVLSETMATLAPSDSFARALLGRMGEVTAELIEDYPDQFDRGDIVGRSGLQAVYNETLAGYPGWRIRINRQFPLTDDTGRQLAPDDPANIVTVSDPTAGTPIQTTINATIQEAADQAVAQMQQPTSLVAVRASTGEVLAVANGPSGSTDNFALTGQYPPGSVFKIISAYAALEAGFGIESEIDCPPTVQIDGREFRNSNFQGFGRVRFRDAFAYSCNTSFIELALSLDGSVFPSTARRFGVGAEYGLGVSSFSGSVPNPGDRVERAATSFGQARVLVSPLSMAVMSGTAANGVYFTPQLVFDEEVYEPVAVDRLDDQAVNQLRDMMAAVVDYGTGGAARDVPGGRVHAKTGTAQFGDGNPPAAHAWFTGYQDDVAFAVVVEGGGGGGSVAAPVAADFLRRINQQ